MFAIRDVLNGQICISEILTAKMRTVGISDIAEFVNLSDENCF